MQVIQFALDLYFASVLGIAGIAKANNASLFIHMLQNQYRIPLWGSRILGRIFPWIEVSVAVSLLIPIRLYRLIIICSLFLLFLVFLLAKLSLIKRNQLQSSCGCYGEITKKQNLFQDILTIILQIGFLLFLFFLTLWTFPPSWQYYLISFVLLIGFYSWLFWKVRLKYRTSVLGNG